MIGFRTLIFLLEAGYKVRAAVRNQAGFDRISKLKPVAPYVSQLTSIVVPDITTPGAYDEAVQGVEYVVHVASPLASNAPPGIDYDSYMIQPAIHGTVGLLESAIKTTGIKRIVITGSILSVVTPQGLGSGEYINGTLHIYNCICTSEASILTPSRGVTDPHYLWPIHKRLRRLWSVQGRRLQQDQGVRRRAETCL